MVISNVTEASFHAFTSVQQRLLSANMKESWLMQIACISIAQDAKGER